MARTVFAMITLLDDRDAIDPGYGRPGGGPHPGGGPIYHPGHPDHGLPSAPGGGDPGYDKPIHHPGHPDHGLPSGGHISNRLPWAPGSPDNTLPVPPGVTPPPGAVPPNLASKLVVLWRLPNTVEWHGKVIDPALVAGTPLPPTAEPKPA